MLFLELEINSSRFLIEASKVKEILPLVPLHQGPASPSTLAGSFNYRGTPVPVIDVSMVLSGKPAEHLMSTRIIVVAPAGRRSEGGSLIALLAERMFSTIELNPARFIHNQELASGDSLRGPLLTDASGVREWLKVERLLSLETRGAA